MAHDIGTSCGSHRKPGSSSPRFDFSRSAIHANRIERSALQGSTGRRLVWTGMRAAASTIGASRATAAVEGGKGKGGQKGGSMALGRPAAATRRRDKGRRGRRLGAYLRSNRIPPSSPSSVSGNMRPPISLKGPSILARAFRRPAAACGRTPWRATG